MLISDKTIDELHIDNIVRVFRLAENADQYELTCVERHACRTVLEAAVGQAMASDEDIAIVRGLLDRTADQLTLVTPPVQTGG